MEGIPVDGILVVWGLFLGVVLVFSFHVAVDGDRVSVIALGIRIATLVMVLLYVVDRGRLPSESSTSTPVSSTNRAQIVTNLRVGAAAGVWFIGALSALVFGVTPNALMFVFTGTGVGVVLLYAIAVGLQQKKRLCQIPEHRYGDRSSDSEYVDDATVRGRVWDATLDFIAC